MQLQRLSLRRDRNITYKQEKGLGSENTVLRGTPKTGALLFQNGESQCRGSTRDKDQEVRVILNRGISIELADSGSQFSTVF